VTVKLFPTAVRKVKSPVLETEKSVVLAPVLEVEPIAKRRFEATLVVEAACMEKSAAGDEEPTPTKLLKSAVPPTFSVLDIVLDPVTESAEVVAPTVVRLVCTAFVEKKFVEVALVVVPLIAMKLFPVWLR
jgi:hypothetical protein